MNSTYPNISPIHSRFPAEFPPDLQEAYFLAKGQYDRQGTEFGIVLFRDKASPFRHTSLTGLASVSMMAFPRQAGTSVEQVLSLIPQNALALGDRFYARDQRGHYFACAALSDGARAEPVSSIGLLSKVERDAQHQMARGLCQAMLDQKNEPAIIFLEKEFRDDLYPMFSINTPDAVWVMQNPDLLGQIGFSCGWTSRVTPDLESAMRQWPENHVTEFFRNSRRYAQDLKESSLESLALKLEPHQVVAVMRAGYFPGAVRTPGHPPSDTTLAFEHEWKSLEEVLGGPNQVLELMTYRRAARSPEVMEKLVEIETRLPQNKAVNLPDVAHLDVPEGGFPISEQGNEIKSNKAK